MQSTINSSPWNQPNSPKKILVIRYQATGDLVITLPYLTSFKKNHPDTQVHLLTRYEVKAIPTSLSIFDKVISVGGGRNAKFQFFLTLFKLPMLMLNGYDVVMDLQNHTISRVVRKILNAKAWCEFDRYSPKSSGERNRITIESLNLGEIDLNTNIQQSINEKELEKKLIANGWNGSELIILNPAGAFETRHWPIQNYVDFAHLWNGRNKSIQFLVTGLRSKIGSEVSYLRKNLSDKLIDLTDITNAAEAFALVRLSKLILTEDGGLMHMAWTQGVPTLALFGSSRSDWSAPLGEWSLCLNSSDLPCGNCLLEKCKYGDVHCLTRYSPEFVFEKSVELLRKINS